MTITKNDTTFSGGDLTAAEIARMAVRENIKENSKSPPRFKNTNEYY